MLAHSLQGSGSAAFVLLHFLGGSHRTWFPVLPHLDDGYRCAALDTPGFGSSADIPGYSVAEMADHVAHTVAALALDRVVLVGHSMTGKVAMVLASRRPSWLSGLVLVAPSPIVPQPMSDADRASQRRYGKTRSEAEQFVDTSSAHRLPDAMRDVAIADAQRVNLDAWRHWVDHGSKEDWSATLPAITCPSLLICGADDRQVPDVETQGAMNFRHFTNVRSTVIEGAGHLMPLQTPMELARILLDFAGSLDNP
ncbi:MAG: alpha/beta hydrolase [Burkholderia gladioli]